MGARERNRRMILKQNNGLDWKELLFLQIIGEQTTTQLMKRLGLSLLLLAFGLFLSHCQPDRGLDTEQLYAEFRQPASEYRPFVRWWWNGDKVEADELVRELRLLKEAGIGGVEINPIAFPTYCDSLDKPSLQWLSPE